MNLQDHLHFSGSAGELADLAIVCGKDWGLPVDPDKTNERLVRYYVSEGIVDRPDRVGRDAAYGYRHLLQLLTARRMMQSGVGLSVIGPHNSTSTTKALEEGLTRPLPTAAELLVGSFLQSKREGRPLARAASVPGVMPPVASPRPSKPAPPGPSIVDVLDEVRQIRGAWSAELSNIHALRHELGSLGNAVDRAVSGARAAMQHAESTRDEMHHLVKRLEARLAELGDRLLKQDREVQHMLQELLDRVPKATPPARKRSAPPPPASKRSAPPPPARKRSTPPSRS